MPKRIEKVDMRQLPGVNWQAIEDDYVRCIPPKELASKYGVQIETIYKRAKRNGWTAVKAQVVQQVAEAKSDLLRQTSGTIRDSLSQELTDSVSALRKRKPTSNIDALSKRTKVINSIVQSASTVFGWSDTNTTTTISIEQLNPNSAPVLDVITSVDPIANIPQAIQQIDTKPSGS